MTADWTVAWSSAAERSLGRVPEKVGLAAIAFVVGPLTDNPLRTTKPLHDELDGYRSARVGDYRILIRVDDDSRRVLIARIEHRSTVYRPRTQALENREFWQRLSAVVIDDDYRRETAAWLGADLGPRSTD